MKGYNSGNYQNGSSFNISNKLHIQLLKLTNNYKRIKNAKEKFSMLYQNIYIYIYLLLFFLSSKTAIQTRIAETAAFPEKEGQEMCFLVFLILN